MEKLELKKLENYKCCIEPQQLTEIKVNRNKNDKLLK